MRSIILEIRSCDLCHIQVESVPVVSQNIKMDVLVVMISMLHDTFSETKTDQVAIKHCNTQRSVNYRVLGIMGCIISKKNEKP